MEARLPDIVIFDWDDTLMDLNRKKMKNERLYHPRPEAAQVLKYLSDAGVAMGVISLSAGHIVRTEVARQGWRNYFRAVVGSGDSETPKPHIHAWQWWLFQSKMQLPKSVWMIGDSDIDHHFADEIGAMRCLAIQFLRKELFG